MLSIFFIPHMATNNKIEENALRPRLLNSTLANHMVKNIEASLNELSQSSTLDKTIIDQLG